MCVYQNVLCSALLHYLLRIVLKDRGCLVAKGDVCGGGRPLNKKQTCCGLKWGCDCGVLDENLGTQDGNLLFCCSLQNWLHSVMDMQKYDTMESLRTWSTMLYTIFSFYKPWPYSFSHALKMTRGVADSLPKILSDKDWASLCSEHLVCLPCFKRKEKLHCVHCTSHIFCSVCFSFYFQRCPVRLQWPQYNHLANIFCPYVTNKVDISDSFSFGDVVLYISQNLTN